MNKKNWVDFKEIKTTVRIEQILEHYGLLSKLTKKGNNLVGPCPIHKGTNPTQFHVSLEKNNFNCFGDCHGGGNVLDFVCKIENVDIRKAALMVKEWFNIKADSEIKNKKEDEKQPLPETKLVKEIKEEKTVESTTVNLPLAFVLKNLDPEHPYLKDRGLTEETIKYFGLGYCKKGLMAGRIAIPVHNENGELVAYVGRWTGEPPENEPKYKVPPGFHKSLVVFNLHRAKEIAKEKGLILVEGFFDCMKVWQAGYKNVVTLMGSSLSEEQEKLILDTVGTKGKIILMFDEDEAGRACREDCLKSFATQMYVKVIELKQEGLQPDELNEEEIKKLKLHE